MLDTFLKKVTVSCEATVYLPLDRTRICHQDHHDDLNTTSTKSTDYFSSERLVTAELDSRKVHESTDSVLSCSCAAPVHPAHCYSGLVRTPGPTLWTHGLIVWNITSRAHPNHRRRFPPVLFILFTFFIFPHCFSLLMQGQFSTEITLLRGNSCRKQKIRLAMLVMFDYVYVI